MTVYNKLDEKVFASQAKPRETENFPNIARGWGISFEQTAGIPPMEWFNGLFKRIDEHILYLAQRGLAEWSSTLEYPQGAYVQYNGKTYRSLQQNTNQRPDISRSAYWARWGFALDEIPYATLSQKGLAQLYTGYDSQREDLALTPKTAYLLKALIDSNSRSLNNCVPNSKKSDSTDSNSSDTVATSKAVKDVKDIAESKQSPATTLAGYGISDFKVGMIATDESINDYTTPGFYYFERRGSKSGEPYIYSDGMSLEVMALSNSNLVQRLYSSNSRSGYQERNYINGKWSSWSTVKAMLDNNSASDVNYSTTLGTYFIYKNINNSPDKQAEWVLDVRSYNGKVRQIARKMGSLETYERYRANNAWSEWKRTDGVDWSDVREHPTTLSGYGITDGVNKAGDTMTGNLNINVDDFSAINQFNTAGNQARIEGLPDHDVQNFYKMSYRTDEGKKELHSVHFPKRGIGKNVAYEDWVLGLTTSIWDNLNNLLTKHNENKSTWYGGHYLGCDVHRIPISQSHGLKIQLMMADVGNGDVISFPETFQGLWLPLAVDVGGGNDSVGFVLMGDNQMRVVTNGRTNMRVMGIGWYRYP